MKTKCANCKKEIERRPCRIRPQNYCGAKCQIEYEYKKGIRDKNTITQAANKARYNGATQKNFRTRLFQTKPNVCFFCGTKKDLEAHHIVPQKYNGRKATGKGDHRLHNGIILCRPCHIEAHRRQRRAAPNGRA